MADRDPRVTPARPDLAARHLEGTVTAARFVEGTPYEIHAPQAPLRRYPTPDSPLDSEALLGEPVTIYEINDEGWAWGQLDEDGYVGWLPAEALRSRGLDLTHTVRTVRTLAFPGRSIKAPPQAMLPFGARLHVVSIEGALAATTSGFVPTAHLAPIGENETDFVAVAERFLHTPYLWGGKTSNGIDCSGLVQVALAACGIACPRDSDMQEQALGSPVAPTDPSTRLRGDLMFWRGHVAIVRDGTTLIHANAHHMAVAIEPIAGAVARIRASGSDIATIRRLGLHL